MIEMPFIGSVAIPVLIRGHFLGISDLHAALKPGLKEKMDSARYRERDEKNKITWVYDRLQGLTVDNCIPAEKETT